MVIDGEWTLRYRYKEINFWRGVRKYEIPQMLQLPAWFIFQEKKRKKLFKIVIDRRETNHPN